MSRTLGRTGRTIPAALLAVVVLVVALAGSATAAKLITGKQIKDGTVTTKDVKNGSLKGADVKNGSLRAADLAPNAKNEVRVHDGNDTFVAACADTALDDCPPIVAVPLPAGTWLVTASVTIDNFAGPATSLTTKCGVFRNGTVIADARTPLAADGAAGEAQAITLQAVVASTGANAPASLRCTEAVGENIRANGPVITALKVS